MGAGMNVAELRAKIRDIKDFPTEGILFKDITTLLKDGPAFRAVVDMLAERYARERVDVVVGIESRGFIFAGAVAHRSEEHTSELQSRLHLVCRLLLEKKNTHPDTPS